MLQTLRARYSAYEWIPVTHGMSGATTYRLDGREQLYVKTAGSSGHPDPRSNLVAEAERIEWLASAGIPGPRLLESGELDGQHWLVMSAVPGRVASDPWPTEQRSAVIDAVAEMLRALHALPAERCPFDRTLDTALGNARRAVDGGLTDGPAEAMEQWKREQDSGALLAELEATRPVVEELAVCHGDYCLPNVVVDPETLAPTGLVDLGRLGRADRYADLALMSGSIGSTTMNRQYDTTHVARFLTGYGADPSDTRLTYYRRMDQLF